MEDEIEKERWKWCTLCGAAQSQAEQRSSKLRWFFLYIYIKRKCAGSTTKRHARKVKQNGIRHALLKAATFSTHFTSQREIKQRILARYPNLALFLWDHVIIEVWESVRNVLKEQPFGEWNEIRSEGEKNHTTHRHISHSDIKMWTHIARTCCWSLCQGTI